VELKERIVSGRCAPLPIPLPDIELREFVSSECGATAFSTGTTTFQPKSELPYHTHRCSEAIIVLSGAAVVAVEGRAYRLAPYDCIHLPAAIAHRIAPAADAPMVALYAFASATTARYFVSDDFRISDRGHGQPQQTDPEFILRFAAAHVYEPSEGAFFRDLFAARFGAVGICGGYGVFRPGASLPCHFHKFDESITIVSGKAVCLVEGNRHELSSFDTAFVPVGRVHRFVNNSEEDMAMIWVYAGSEPERTIVDASYCSGEARWRGTGSE
jgi:quercetin dioxygenase-like cupin family protein